jgi:hypothetical protein
VGRGGAAGNADNGAEVVDEPDPSGDLPLWQQQATGDPQRASEGLSMSASNSEPHHTERDCDQGLVFNTDINECVCV